MIIVIRKKLYVCSQEVAYHVTDMKHVNVKTSQGYPSDTRSTPIPGVMQAIRLSIFIALDFMFLYIKKSRDMGFGLSPYILQLDYLSPSKGINEAGYYS
jgi:hypothetical protein